MTLSILEGVNLSPELEASRDAIRYDTGLGFLTTDVSPTERELGQKTLLGFGVSGWQKGIDEVEESFRGITTISDLAPDVLTIGRQGKGIGPRLYNTPQALSATAEQPSTVGMYAFNINPQLILDKRRATDKTPVGKMRRVMEHGWLKLAGGLLGETRAIYTADQRLGEAEAVLYSQTPHGERQQIKSQQPSSTVSEELMIVRRPNTVFTKIGEYTSFPQEK